MKQKIIYVLIGPPAIGKSTWIKRNTNPSETFIISRDDIVEKVANSLGWSYDDMFAKPSSLVEPGDVNEKFGEVIGGRFKKVSEANEKVLELLHQKLDEAKNTDKSVVVVDMINMNAKERKEILDKTSNPNDIKVAVIFKFQGKLNLIKSVAQKREKETAEAGNSKTIPNYVYDKLINNYEKPTPEEGYDKIIHADTIPQLKKYIDLKESRLFIKNEIRKAINQLF